MTTNWDCRMTLRLLSKKKKKWHRCASLLTAANSVCARKCVCGWVCADSRHRHIASVDDDVSELWISLLVWKVEGKGGPQRLMETSQAGDRGSRGVIGGRSPSSLKTHVADGLVGGASIVWLSRLRKEKQTGRQRWGSGWESKRKREESTLDAQKRQTRHTGFI